jgi:hypothetical protein
MPAKSKKHGPRGPIAAKAAAAKLLEAILAKALPAVKELEDAAAEACGYLNNLDDSDPRLKGARGTANRLAAALRGIDDARDPRH